MPDLYAYAHLLAEEKHRRPGHDVMAILLAQVDDDGGQVSVEEFENMFWLFAVAGNETLRNGLRGACIGLLDHPNLHLVFGHGPHFCLAAHLARGQMRALFAEADADGSAGVRRQASVPALETSSAA